MSLYELLGTVLATLACLLGYHKWLMSYIDQNDSNTNKELANLINSLQVNQKLLWDKIDKANERLIVLDHTSVNESSVRHILEEYRLQNKSDRDEVKQILHGLVASLDALKTEAAIAKALQQREPK